MATYSTQATVDLQVADYRQYIENMTYDASASVLVTYKLQATAALELWGDSALAVQNLNAAAASNYSSSVGTSVTKRELQDAMSAASSNLEAFAVSLLRGGVTLPTSEAGSAIWDMSGSY
jgi:hypothetical protein